MEWYFVYMLLLPIIYNDFYIQNMFHNINQKAKSPPIVTFFSFFNIFYFHISKKNHDL